MVGFTQLVELTTHKQIQCRVIGETLLAGRSWLGPAPQFAFEHTTVLILVVVREVPVIGRAILVRRHLAVVVRIEATEESGWQQLFRLQDPIAIRILPLE